jgi:hypothetical protein
MRTLKTYMYEVIAALALLGLLYIYLADQGTDQGFLTRAEVMVVALYVLIAVATEALIVSSLRPEMSRVFVLNVLIAAIVSVSGWMSNASLRVVGCIAIGTLILRLSVAGVSLRAPIVLVRRLTAGLAGSVFLLETLSAIYSTGEQIYYDYYFYPKVKEGFIMPTRWRDFVEQAVFFVIAALVLYLSYRLLKYAFRSKPAVTA